MMMDISMISAWMSVVLLAVFLGIVAWAWSGARASRFAAAARLPLDDDDGAEAPASARDAGAQR